MATLCHEVWINSPTTKVYAAISTADGVSAWWDKQTATQTSEGAVLEHNPGPEHGFSLDGYAHHLRNHQTICAALGR